MEALLFDMDGVLVDVSESFRTIVVDLALELGASDVGFALVQSLKERGGFNDDIMLTQEILRMQGIDVPFDEVRARFDEMYQGSSARQGMWARERWLVPAAHLVELGHGRRLGIVTGRNRVELGFAERLAGTDAWRTFECFVVQDDLPRHRWKPAPDGLLMAMGLLGAGSGTYVGDAVDDMRAARAAGLRAIGVLPPGTGAGARLRGLLFEAGAHVVVDDILQIASVL